MTSLGYTPLTELDYSLMESDKQMMQLRKLLGELEMKQCRYCDAEVPYYGADLCFKCKLIADYESFKAQLANREPLSSSECAKEDVLGDKL